MILSMTGFANCEAIIGNVTQSIEIRSINSKFLDLSIKLPKVYSNFESELREIIRQKISRGKVTITVFRNSSNKNILPLEINKDTVRYLNILFKNLKKEAKIKEPVKLEHYLKFAEVFSLKDEEANDDELESLINLTKKATEILMESKINEGNQLKADIEYRINLTAKYIQNIIKIWRKISKQEWKRLQEKVDLLIEDKNIDPKRFEIEIALLLDKIDITEECIRYNSHIKFFKEAIESKEPAGKRLNFITQELLREANTIASKSNNAEISQYVVKIKEELEKIREQLQNIE